MLVGVCLPFLGGLFFLLGGGIPVATKGPPLPLERKVAQLALHAAMKASVNDSSPFSADESHFRAGAKTYFAQCQVCHGLPNQPASWIAQGLFPKPPQLFSPEEGVTDDPVGEIYWKVKNGIRLTGMPGFEGRLLDPEIWEVSLLLLNADKLPSSILQALKPSKVVP